MSPIKACLLALGAMLLASCQRSHVALDDDAYIWQRQWTPRVVDAMRASAADVHAWRVLAAQTDAKGRLRSFEVDLAALVMSGHPVVAVVRIDGQLAHWDEDALLAQVLALREAWRAVPLAGIEIDHDCGTARLPEYARFLAHLKAKLGGLPLSITALPAWLSSPALDRVLAQVDTSVLQVHAVQSPHAGLFDARLAAAWASDFAGHTTRPFRIALPTYASRVSFDADGRLLGVESELPNLAGGVVFSELAASPQAISAFARGMRDAPLRHLAGFVWFRLPTDDDTRAWSLSTWHAVMRGLPLSSHVSVQVRPGAMAGALDLLLRNDGDIDASLPVAVHLPAGCALADGVNGYARVAQADGVILRRRLDGWLRAHTVRVIGWARCTQDAPAPRIEV
ncbi:DUF3142 domain-containing protein [Dyella sp.]|uniref:DUF3142 domain-containing protein n=1 Tax=Dyella sp. TaxID=1869338 RepID=UPI002ED65ECC